MSINILAKHGIKWWWFCDKSVLTEALGVRTVLSMCNAWLHTSDESSARSSYYRQLLPPPLTAAVVPCQRIEVGVASGVSATELSAPPRDSAPLPAGDPKPRWGQGWAGTSQGTTGQCCRKGGRVGRGCTVVLRVN